MLLFLRLLRSGTIMMTVVLLSSSLLWAQVESVALPKSTTAQEETEGHSLYITLAEAQKLALEGNATLRSQQLSLEASKREAQSRWNSFCQESVSVEAFPIATPSILPKVPLPEVVLVETLAEILPGAGVLQVA